jgi:ADP-ribose pyrophosphatase YjhB (NUDIX family)
MGKAARAIIIEDGKMLVMHRNKNGSEYFTLVGGRSEENEPIEKTLIREIREETGLEIITHRLVYTENHAEPYNEQYIFLCEVAPHGEVAIQDYAEENLLNRFEVNLHKPVWVATKNFRLLSFRTPQLYAAILKGLEKGFPKEPVKL